MQDRVDPSKIKILSRQDADGMAVITFGVPNPEGGWSSSGARLRWLRAFRERLALQLGNESAVEFVEP